jgi:hypothetical protein
MLQGSAVEIREGLVDRYLRFTAQLKGRLPPVPLGLRVAGLSIQVEVSRNSHDLTAGIGHSLHASAGSVLFRVVPLSATG